MALPQWYVNTKDIFADIWVHAGTKVIGWFSFLVGTLGVLDATTIGVLQSYLPPKLAHALPFICLMAAGWLTKQRGNRNTADIADTIINRANSGDPTASSVVSKAATNAVAAADKVLLVKPPETKP